MKGKHFRTDPPADPERRRFLASSAAVVLSIVGYKVLTDENDEPAYGDETYG